MLLPSIFTDSLLDDWMGFDPFQDMERADRKLYGHKSSRMMSTDVREHEDGYEVDIDLPGFKKEEIDIKLEQGYLTVAAAKSMDQDEKKHGKLIRQERYSGAVQRSFYVGEHLAEEDIKASFEHGVLKLEIPKKDPNKLPAEHRILIA